MSKKRPRRHRRLIFVGAFFFLLLMCCCLPVTCVDGNPFERIKDVTPLGTLRISSEVPFQHHAIYRDELVFLRDGKLEVYRVGRGSDRRDSRLTQLREVALQIEDAGKLRQVSAFPTSARAAVPGSREVFIVSTLTGEVEKRIPFTGAALVSPDEHWLVMNTSPLTVVDLLSSKQFKVDNAPQWELNHLGMTFVGPDAFFAKSSQSSDCYLWDLRTGARRWIESERDEYVSFAAARNETRIVTGSADGCQVRDAQTGQVIRFHSASRRTTAIAMHPKTGDYLAGHSVTWWSPLTAGLGGAVRIWNADGERLTTFRAYDGGVGWMTVSASGDYLVTGAGNSVKVWDYHALTKR